MAHALVAALAAALIAAPAAVAATVSGELAYCDTGDECRYFPDPRLEVTFLAARGEENELRVLPHESGVRFAGSAPIVAGENCSAVSESDVRCGPAAPGGLVVETRTGDGDDFVFVRIGTLALGRGDDQGRGSGVIAGGPGEDDIRAVSGLGGVTFRGGAGDDVVVGRSRADVLAGGRGPDLVVGGHGADDVSGGGGRDQLAGGFGADAIAAGAGDDLIRAADGDRDRIRCGPGADRAFVDRRDRLVGCERVQLGWPG
jgi:hypothetical protein